MKCRIYFADEQVREAFLALQASQDPEDRRLAELLVRALGRIAAGAFCGGSGAEEADPERLQQETRAAEESLEV